MVVLVVASWEILHGSEPTPASSWQNFSKVCSVGILYIVASVAGWLLRILPGSEPSLAFFRVIYILLHLCCILSLVFVWNFSKVCSVGILCSSVGSGLAFEEFTCKQASSCFFCLQVFEILLYLCWILSLVIVWHFSEVCSVGILHSSIGNGMSFEKLTRRQV